MIITFWIFVSWLLDTPEQRLRLEARRMADAIEKYNDRKNLKLHIEKYIDNKYTNDESRNYDFC